ncbi:hypothetical protein B0T19DRAFT_398629 [Cercophora scortea]|uniref:Uncharacterized protein n=1 Tax=Cercophora scortea TaxID=314031 RepID=A0AAE0IX41_9PEZI|nr:hypothetical protein B0T19DRAFT_398629 [Cercophora scortea]
MDSGHHGWREMEPVVSTTYPRGPTNAVVQEMDSVTVNMEAINGSKMIASLELLPQELFDDVLRDLHDHALAQLLSCNKLLRRRVEPRLYGQEISRDKAIRWACRKGFLPTIFLATSYDDNAAAPKLPVEYLRLAARNGHEDVFKVLVEMGALNYLDMDECRLLVRTLCSPGTKNKFVSYMYPHKFGDTIQTLRQGPNVAQPLVPLIRAGAPPDLIRLVVSRGADLNMKWPYKTREVMSPLSAAVFANSESLFLLLLQLGAKIDGGNFEEASALLHHGLHIPVFAAARTMAIARHGRAMMELCLAQGSRIDHCVPSFDVHLQRLNEPDRYYLVTPMIVYLQSIKSWKTRLGEPTPAEELVWLLDKGAWLWPTWKEKTGLAWSGAQWIPFHTCIEWLLGKWGIAALRYPNFVAVIKFLLQPEYRKGYINIHLVFLRYFIDELGGVNARWRASVHGELKALILATLSDLSAGDITTNLEMLIYCMRTLIRETEYDEVKKKLILNAEAIDMMRAVGGDINTCRGRTFNGLGYSSSWPQTQPDDEPRVLHVICAGLCRLISGTEHMALATHDIRNTAGILEILIQKGADPMITTGGRSAFDILLAPWARNPSTSRPEGWKKTRGQALADCLADILRGKAFDVNQLDAPVH